ncbi:MAG: TIGR03086 family metal-binding protein [Acidimicrobiia bacterium]|nr:TIGR03086 family metal-binding protein [Acidimicrobiia bacterium]
MRGIDVLHRRACEAFGAVVERVGDGQWSRPTPCTEWDVRALLAHNVVENLWVPLLLEGRTVGEVGDRFAGDVLGDDPRAAWRASVEPAAAAFEAPSALERIVHLSYGDERAGEYAWQRFADLVVHGWDLARAVGAPERIDPELAEACLGWAEPLREVFARMPSLFDPPLESPPGAGVQTRLLHLFGRRP